MLYGYALNEAKTIIALEPMPLPLDNMTENIADDFASSQAVGEDEDVKMDDTTINIKTDAKSNISEKEELLTQGVSYEIKNNIIQYDQFIALGDLIEDKSYERKINLLSLLTRKEAIDLLSIISLANLSVKKVKLCNLIFTSINHFYTFGALIHNNLIYQSDNNIGITELCFNLIDSIG